MKQTKKNIFAIAGVISMVLGITVTIPSLGQGNYILATLSGIFIIVGLLLIAIAFGD